MKSKTPLLPLLWVMLFDHASLNMTFPVLTLIFFDAQSSLFTSGTSQAVRSMWYGLCVAVPHLVNIFITPILSALSDEVGRKKILLLATSGALLFALVAGLGILWGLLSLLLLGNIIRGAFSRTNPIAQAVIGDISTTENKVRDMGYLQLAISLGAFVGPVMGGYFANPFFFKQLNFSLPYFIAAVFALVSCLLMIFLFEETHVKEKAPSFKKLGFEGFVKIILNPHVIRISIILLLTQVSWSLYYQFIPPILKTTLHFSAHSLGLFIGMIAFWLALTTGLGIKQLRKIFSLEQMLIGSLYVVLFGLLLSVAACWFNGSTFSHVVIWLAAMPIAVGDVIAFSCLIALYSDAVLKEEQGKVMGVCFIVIGVVWALTALVGGMMMSYVDVMPLAVAPLGVLLAILTKRML